MAFLLRKTTVVDMKVFVSEEPQPAVNAVVTSQLRLKSHKNSVGFVKDVVLCRIRLQKRVNRVRSVMRSLLNASERKGHVPEARNEDFWLDDAFSAP